MKNSKKGSDYEDSIKNLQQMMKAVKKAPTNSKSVSAKNKPNNSSSTSSKKVDSTKNQSKKSESKKSSSKSTTSKSNEVNKDMDSKNNKKSSLGTIFEKVDKILDEDQKDNIGKKEDKNYSSIKNSEKNNESSINIQKTVSDKVIKDTSDIKSGVSIEDDDKLSFDNTSDIKSGVSIEDDDKLSFDKLEIDETEEPKLTESDENSSSSFEDNILNNVDDIFEDNNKSSVKNDEEDNMSSEDKSFKSDVSKDDESLQDSDDTYKDSDFKSLNSASFISKISKSSKEVEVEKAKNQSKKQSDKKLKSVKTEESTDEKSDEEDKKPKFGLNKDKIGLIPILGIVVGVITIILGIYIVSSRSARVVDSVASGEYVGMAILLFIIGAICFIFSLMQIISIKTPFDSTFDKMKSIDREDINMDDFLSEINKDDNDEGSEELKDEVQESDIKFDLEDNEDNYNVTKKSFDSDYVKTDSDDFKITINTSINKKDNNKEDKD